MAELVVAKLTLQDIMFPGMYAHKKAPGSASSSMKVLPADNPVRISRILIGYW